VTQDWDAICALDADKLSSFCFAQYLQSGPTTPSSRLRFVVNDDNIALYLLDLLLGPMEVSFPPGSNGPQCQVTFEVLRGEVVVVDGNTSLIKSKTSLQINQNVITGTVDLNKVTGSDNAVGKVTLDLASGAYSPTIQGITKSVLADKIGDSIQLYFHNNPTSYLLGTLVTDPSSPPSLKPTDFMLNTQAAPSGGGDGCVVIFVRTSSTQNPPNHGPLETYPIPNGYSASIAISNQVIFNQLMLDSLSKQFKNFGTTFHGIQDESGNYTTVGSGGTVTLPEIISPDKHTYSHSYGDHGTETPVAIGMDNFTLSPGTNSLNVNWVQNNSQTYEHVTINRYGNFYRDESVAGTTTLTESAIIGVDEASNITFTGSPTVNYKAQSYGFWDLFFGSFNLDGTMQNNINWYLKNALAEFQLPGINTFAIRNLLFPNSNLVTLTTASIPSDLVANGNINSPLAVSPARSVFSLSGLPAVCAFSVAFQVPSPHLLH
jgi:hypothetical protein